MPAVNQLELHPRFSSPELQMVAKEIGVVLTGYGTGNSVLIESPNAVVQAIAEKVGKSVVQVVTRWTARNTLDDQA
jgi:2,5-diketo-D-gluconate reductase A